MIKNHNQNKNCLNYLEIRPGLRTPVTPQSQRVPGPEPVLQMLRGADALEPPVDHDAHACAEGLALLHRVGGEHDGLAAADHLQDAVP